MAPPPDSLPNLDAATIRAARLALAGNRRGLRAVLPFFGPAFIASVAYVDPGNFATNIQSGAQFGYLLLWVVVASNLLAMLVQALSAKLGIATGLNLAEVCREQLARPAVWGLWLVSELAAIATDVAEVVGAAIGFQLLFGIALFPAGLLTAFVTFAILSLQQFGFRLLEAVITALVGVIALCYVAEMLLIRPDWSQIAAHAIVPQFDGQASVLLAVGILGATVMPHVVFLHSHLTQDRIPPINGAQAQRIFRFELLDVVVALSIAGLVNVAMLVTAAATLHETGNGDVATIEEAYHTLTPLLGGAASTIFAVSLLASGLSSATVGTVAGQVILQGYLRRSVPLWLRRGVTMLPALVLLAVGVDPTRALVLSQVALSFCLPFTLVPLLLFTRRRDLMGSLVNRRLTTAVAGVAITLIAVINAYLLVQTFAAATVSG